MLEWMWTELGMETEGLIDSRMTNAIGIRLSNAMFWDSWLIELPKSLALELLAVPRLGNLPAAIGFNLPYPLQVRRECWLRREFDVFFVEAAGEDYVSHVDFWMGEIFCPMNLN
jgi:hypothetical protein